MISYWFGGQGIRQYHWFVLNDRTIRSKYSLWHRYTRQDCFNADGNIHMQPLKVNTVAKSPKSDICGFYQLKEEKLKQQRLITKTRLFKCIENFTTWNWKFSDKNSDMFSYSAQNIDCEYS